MSNRRETYSQWCLCLRLFCPVRQSASLLKVSRLRSNTNKQINERCGRSRWTCPSALRPSVSLRWSCLKWADHSKRESSVRWTSVCFPGGLSHTDWLCSVIEESDEHTNTVMGKFQNCLCRLRERERGRRGKTSSGRRGEVTAGSPNKDCPYIKSQLFCLHERERDRCGKTVAAKH